MNALTMALWVVRLGKSANVFSVDRASGTTSTSAPVARNGRARNSDVAKQQPVARLATASEIAMGVLLLMANGAMTGEVLHVDGGRRRSEVGEKDCVEMRIWFHVDLLRNASGSFIAPTLRRSYAAFARSISGSLRSAQRLSCIASATSSRPRAVTAYSTRSGISS
jgi:hypothetical protein